MKKLIRKIWMVNCFIWFSCTNNFLKTNEEDMAETIAKNSSCEYEKKDTYSRNDIVVVEYFNKIFDRKFISILRVVGIPGDSVIIRKGEVYINGNQYEFPSTALLAYKLYFNKKLDSFNLIKDFSLQRGYLPNSFFLTRIKLDQLVNENKIDSSERVYFPASLTQKAIIGSVSFNWNMDNFGPLKIHLNDKIIPTKERELYYHETSYVSQISDKYYFLIGDNFYKSMDSRIIGLIPKNNIFGSVINIKNLGAKKEIIVDN